MPVISHYRRIFFFIAIMPLIELCGVIPVLQTLCRREHSRYGFYGNRTCRIFHHIVIYAYEKHQITISDVARLCNFSGCGI